MTGRLMPTMPMPPIIWISQTMPRVRHASAQGQPDEPEGQRRARGGAHHHVYHLIRRPRIEVQVLLAQQLGLAGETWILRQRSLPDGEVPFIGRHELYHLSDRQSDGSVPNASSNLKLRFRLPSITCADRAVRVVQVAEHQCARRAGLHAGRDHLISAQRSAFRKGRLLRPVDALHAEGALLHHAQAAHSHVRVELLL